MKCFFLLLPFFAVTTSFAQNELDLKFRFSGMVSGEEVYLAYHLGNKQYIADTAVADAKGNFRFTAPKALEQGLYMLAFPANENRFVEFVLDSDQQFEMTATKLNEVATAVFKGSQTNTRFFQHLRKVETFQKEAEGKDEAATAVVSRNYTAYIQQLLREQPEHFLTKMIAFQQRPEIPASITEKTAQFYYYRAHFFDQIDWNFTPIIRTPILYQTIEEYTEKMTVQDPDSVIAACEVLLSKAAVNNELFKHVLITLVNKYAASKLICFDKVYAHLASDYYLNGRAFWLSATSTEDQTTLRRMEERVNRLKYITCGKPVYNFNLLDEQGTSHSLYSLQSPYTVLLFWSSDCHNCENTLKAFVAMSDLLHQKGVQVVTIADATNREQWLAKKHAYPIKNALVLTPANSTELQTLIDRYDVYATPVIFLLDKDKKLLFKRLEANDLQQVIASFPDR